jgi:hypothetical protein
MMILIGALSLAAAGCTTEAPLEDVDKAAQLFFQQVKEADYDRIYDESSTLFQEQKARATVVDNLKQVTSFGTIKQTERLSMTFGTEGDKRVALPVYSVLCEQLRCEFALKFVDIGGEWKLLGFEVKPYPGLAQ